MDKLETKNQEISFHYFSSELGFCTPETRQKSLSIQKLEWF